MRWDLIFRLRQRTFDLIRNTRTSLVLFSNHERPPATTGIVASPAVRFNAKRKRRPLNAMTAPPTKPKAAPDFADARKACRTPEEHERLAKIIKAGWTSAEFHEYARLYFFRNGRDYPTPTSYRRAIADIANCESLRRSAVEGRQFGPQSGLNGLLLTKTKPAGFGAGGVSLRKRKDRPKAVSLQSDWAGDQTTRKEAL
jgi:hypothetical protein